MRFLLSLWQWVGMVLAILTWSSVLTYMVLLIKDLQLYPQVVQALSEPIHVSLLTLIELRDAWLYVNAFMLFILMLVVS